MNKLTIFNLYVKMESQSQCHRMKQLCLDNGLPIWESDIAFEFQNNWKDDCFSYVEQSQQFFILPISGNKFYLKNKTSVTEQQFINLLKEYKDGK